MTKTRPIICSTEHYIKYYVVYFRRKASWLKLAAANFGVGLISDFLQGGGKYKQILTSGLIHYYKQDIMETSVFLLSSYEV